MKKQVVGYMTIGLLAVAMMMQAQPASRPGRNLPLRDSSERIAQMNRMGAMGGQRMGAVRPGQFGQRDSVRAQAPMRRMQPTRELQPGTRQMPQGRNGLAPFGGRPMQRGGAVATPGNNRMQRGGAIAAPGTRMQRGGAIGAPGNRGMQQRGAVAPSNRSSQRGGKALGFGMRNGQQSRPQGLQRGRIQGLQQARPVNPEVRISQEVDQLKKTLELTDNQVKKITDIKKKQAKKEIKAYKKAQKKAEARRKKVQAPNDKIKSVLTEEQVKKYESSRPRVGSGPGVGAGLGGNRLGGRILQR